jgi:ribosomal protein S18 acetylase RimI-like enzyme
VGEVRAAGIDDVDLVAAVAAAGFYDDPVMSWVFDDPATRLDLLQSGFSGLVASYIKRGSTVHIVDDACVTMWRPPDFEYEPLPPREERRQSHLSEEVQERMDILGEVMTDAHPHDEPHWYLNVVSTRPDRQGQGLGAAALRGVLDICDDEGIAAYLESSNPRNMTLYRRQGFVETFDIVIPDGPTLYAMWREPRGVGAR